MSLLLLDYLNLLLREGVAACDGGFPVDSLRWEVPKDPALGDLSTPAPFRLASKLRRSPPEAAQQLVEELQRRCGVSGAARWVERIEAKSGFVNAFLSPEALRYVLAQILHKRGRYGRSRLGRGQRVLLEFVSANPTGPLSVAHGRQAAVGDALARVLRSQGYDATTEYYLNDEGRQIELLGRSLWLRCKEQLGPAGMAAGGQAEPFPEDGYHGSYLVEQAKALVARHGPSLLQRPPAWFVDVAMAEQLSRIKDDLARFGLRFDRWESQRAIRLSKRIDRALEELKSKDLLYDAEEATWFASTKFGDDKDRVVKKQSGELTYLAPDIAYHQWKLQRGYHLLINLWGPDHHGYIARVKAAVAALGYAPEHLAVQLVQLVTLSRHGKPVPMSKRQGEFVTFREILDEVGVDATRFFYLMRTMDSHLDFDLDLAKSQSQENPVYYVQYAHARIWSLLRYASQQIPWTKRIGPASLERLTAPEERLLMRQLFQFPIVTQLCAHAREPQGLTVYLQKLAETFHVFYTKHRVVTTRPGPGEGRAGDDIPTSRARLALITATRWVLANGLGLLGVSAPRRM